MEQITGHIREKREHITGNIREFEASGLPVLVKDSAGLLLWTKNPGEIATIIDSLTKDSAGVTTHSIKAQATQTIPDSKLYNSAGAEIYSVKSEAAQTIPDVIAQNSEGTTIATIKAKSTPIMVADITVTNPITGATYPYPAAKDLTESLYKEIELGFLATYDDSQEFKVTAKSAGTFENEILVNCTVVYEVNGATVTLPFALADTNTYKATITRTNPALDSSVTITT